MDFKIYEFGPDIIVAKNVRDAVRCHIKELDTRPIRELLQEAEVMPLESAEAYTFYDDIDDIYREDSEQRGTCRSLVDQVKKHLADGGDLPCYLCTSEF